MRVAIHEFAHALGVTSERDEHGLTCGEAVNDAVRAAKAHASERTATRARSWTTACFARSRSRQRACPVSVRRAPPADVVAAGEMADAVAILVLCRVPQLGAVLDEPRRVLRRSCIR
jgi:hypothetical protein